jgi:ribosomal protein S18 acetylase RimI-like enzyme
MTQADSLAFDLHKWGWLPYEIGCVLVRSDETLRAAFAASAPYLAAAGRGIAAEPLGFADRGVQLSRGFRALKLWMALKHDGARAWGRLVAQNVAQARHLASLVVAAPDLELLAPVALNVVCFRYRAALPDAELDALNQSLLVELQERGIAVPSGTRVRGRFALRVANTNHRTRREDFTALAQAVRRIGRELELAGPPFTGWPAIVTYRDDHRADFERLNRAWLEALFTVEAEDVAIFSDPRGKILDGGGQIFFLVEGERVLGTVALHRVGPDELELCKLAVDPTVHRRGFGDRLVRRALAYARANGARRVTLLTSTRLEAALRLYTRHGFVVTRRGRHPRWTRVDLEMARELPPDGE